MISYAYAQAAAETSRSSSPLGGFLPLILIFVVFYFLLIRPQQKKEKNRKAMINSLKKGDYVVTSSGIYGTIINIKPDIIELKIDENVKIQLSKNAITSMVTQQSDST